MSQTAWRPNWTVHPGEALADLLEERGWSQMDLCRRLSLSPSYICDLIGGKRGLGVVMALRLEVVFAPGPSAEFWLNLQRDYDLHRARQEMAAELEIIREAAGA